MVGAVSEISQRPCYETVAGVVSLRPSLKGSTLLIVMMMFLDDEVMRVFCRDRSERRPPLSPPTFDQLQGEMRLLPLPPLSSLLFVKCLSSSSSSSCCSWSEVAFLLWDEKAAAAAAAVAHHQYGRVKGAPERKGPFLQPFLLLDL